MFAWFSRLFAGKAARPTAPQTAATAFTRLRQEVAAHPSRGLTPEKLGALLAGAERGDLTAQAELAEDMQEKDAHLYAELAKRQRALLTLDWTVLPPRNGNARARKLAAECQDWLLAMPDFEDVLLNLANALLYGYAALELDWQQHSGLWLPTPYYRPPGWFTVDVDTRTELRLRATTQGGVALQPLGWIVHQHHAKSGYLARAGLVRVLAWPYLFKNYAIKDLSTLLELHGIPLRVGTFPTGTLPDDQDKLWTIIKNLRIDTAALLPEGMKIEFQEATLKSDTHQAMIGWCERSESKAILGQTLSAETSATGLGSGVASLHNDVRWDLISSDARQIASTLTQQLLAPLLLLNRGLDDPQQLPRFAFDLQETADLTAYSEALPKLVAIGMPIPIRWASDKLGIPAPAEGEPTLQPGVASPAEPPLPAATAPARQAALKVAPLSDPTAPLLERLGAEADPLIDALLNPVRLLLETSADLDAFRAGLLDLYPDLDAADFAALMGQALAVADAQGRWEAQA